MREFIRSYWKVGVAIVAVCVGAYWFGRGPATDHAVVTKHEYVGLPVRVSNNKHMGHVSGVYLDSAGKVTAILVRSRGLKTKGTRKIDRSIIERTRNGIKVLLEVETFRQLPRLN